MQMVVGFFVIFYFFSFLDKVSCRPYWSHWVAEDGLEF